MKNFLTGIIMLTSIGLSAQQVAKNLTSTGNVFIGYYEYKPVEYNVDPNTKFPLIIFLHGIGERGNGTTDLPKVLSNGIPKYINSGHPMRFLWNGKWETFLVLSPQLSYNYGDWPNLYVAEMIKYAKQNLRIDTNRIMITGLSLGGGGTWAYPFESLGNAKQLAAIAPVCGTCQFNGSWCNLSNAKLPVWGFHAQDDGVVSANCTIGSIGNIMGCNPAVKPYMTIWPNGSHWIWDRAFDTAYNYQNPNLYEWFLGQDKSLPVNARPTVNAGSDLTISTTTGMVNLSGISSQDMDGTLVRFIWRKISGPSAGTINTLVSTIGLTRISSLTTAGTYKYELKGVDNRADYNLDTVTVVVANSPVINIPPIGEAGLDRTIATTNLTLNGTSSYDPDGFVVSYRWTKIAGPGQYTFDNPNSATPYVSNLGTGTYKFELQATDNLGAIDKDTVTIVETSELLPLQFVYLRGNKSGDAVYLTWATENENGNEYFEIETGSNGTQFHKVGYVKASTISTDKIKKYAYTIHALNLKDVYFRLKQVNTDGTHSYSTVIHIASTSAPSTLQYLPNPVRNLMDLTITNDYTGYVSISFTGIDGRTVKQIKYHKQQIQLNAKIDMQDMAPGIYMMEVNSGKHRELRKIVRM